MICTLTLCVILLGEPPQATQDEIEAHVSDLHHVEGWWVARSALRGIAREGRRLEVERALHEAWFGSSDRTYRRRLRLVTEEVDRDWSQRQRTQELQRLTEELSAALETGEQGEQAAAERRRAAAEALRVALQTTPHPVAVQGLLPFGPPGPSPPRKALSHDPDEVVHIKSSDGTTHDARWIDGRLIMDVGGIQVVLVTDEEQATPEYRSNATARSAARRPTVAVTEESRLAAVDRGLENLAVTQQVDGSWPRPPLDTHDRFFDTALAGIAFLAQGSTTEQGRYREQVERVRDFLLGRLRADGSPVVDDPSGRTWEGFETWYLAFAGLFLTACSEAPGSAVEDGLARIKRRLLLLQRRTGGWNHDQDFRLVQSGSYVFAHYSEDLLAVTNFVVPLFFGVGDSDPQIERASVLRYYSMLQNEDGGFAYGNHHGWSPSLESEAGRSAGALFALRHLGLGQSTNYAFASDYLRQNMEQVPTSPTHGGGLFSLNYLSGALGTLPEPELFEAFRARYFGELLAAQKANGSFVLDNSPWDTPAMGTGIALLVLQLQDGRISLFGKPAHRLSALER